MENIISIKLYKYLAVGNPVIWTRLKGVFKEFWENNGLLYIVTPIQVLIIVQRTNSYEEQISDKGLKFVSNYNLDINMKNLIYSLKENQKT